MIRVGIQFAAGQRNVDLTEGPDAAPTSVSSYTYSGDRIGVQWVNQDLAAETQIAVTADVGTTPSAADFTAPPGATSFATGLNANVDANRCVWWARHARNQQYSAWASGVHADGCTSPAAPPGGGGGTEI